MKNTTILFFLFLPLLAGAQARTITVTVQDTILVVATSIKAQVEFRDTVAYNYDGTEPRTVFADERREIVRILDQNKVSWKNEDEMMPFLGAKNKSYPGMPEKTQSIIIDFTTPEQAEKVLPQLKTIPFTEVTEMGASVNKNEVDKTRLYAKLLKRARTKAELQAKLAGKRVGDVYSIGSEFEQMSPEKYMDSLFGGGAGGFLGQIMGMLSGMFNEKRPDYKVTVSESMSVSFTLLD